MNEEANTLYLASFAEVNITPEPYQGIPLQGLFGPPRLAHGIESPLLMQLLMLEDHNNSRFLIVTADLFGIDSQSVSRIRSHLESWGIPVEAFFFSASHTHYAPGTLTSMPSQMGICLDQYVKYIEDTVIKRIPHLFDTLDEVNIYKSSCKVRIGANRRGLDLNYKRTKMIPDINGSYDVHTPFLIIHHLSNNTRTILVQHSCHPTGLGNTNIISTDYPGHLRSQLKNSGLVHNVMFFQGGAADTKQTIPGNKREFCKSVPHIRQNASILAKSVLDRLADKWFPVKGPLRGTCHRVELDIKQFNPHDAAQRIKNNDLRSKHALAWLEHMSNKSQSVLESQTINLDIQLFGIGNDWHLLTLPAEPVSALSIRLRQLFQNPADIMIAGYTNGLIAYLPTEKMLKEGGYEAESSYFIYGLPGPFKPGIEASIITGAKGILHDLDNSRTSRSSYPRKTIKKGKVFFVMSTGRCGTMTLAYGLSIAHNATVWHHPNPSLILETQLAYWGRINTKKVFWRARGNQIREAWSQDQIYGETDHNMTPFSDMIANEIPSSKFIVLVRHPYDFVRSGIRRNYYDDGNIWDKGRLRPPKGSKEFSHFSNLKQLEKIAWLWNNTYKKILSISENIPDNRIMLVRFEDLVANPDTFEMIFDYLGLQGYNENAINDLLNKKLNSQKRGNYPKPSLWDNDTKFTIWKECGKIAGNFGYKFEPFR